MTNQNRRPRIGEDYEGNILMLIFFSSIAFAWAFNFYLEYFSRVEELTERVPLTSDPAAIVLSKDMGFFAGGYKLVVKAKQGKAQELYVSADEYLSINAGDKICVQYKVIKGEMQGTSLCQSTTGEK